jgi:hypothetical protein
MVVGNSGIAINELSYKKQNNMLSERFIGRKNMLNSFEDGFNGFKKVSLTFGDLTDLETTSVSFKINRFLDGFVGDHNEYEITIIAIPL